MMKALNSSTQAGVFTDLSTCDMHELPRLRFDRRSALHAKALHWKLAI
jgi:hypothetical protein